MCLIPVMLLDNFVDSEVVVNIHTLVEVVLKLFRFSET